MAEARVIPYAPRRVFLPFHNRTQRFAIGVAHRRCGKTVACINDMIRNAVVSDKPHYRAAYLAPYLKQAKDVAWEYLKRYSQPIWAKPPNESELYVELIGGKRIKIYGADNPDALRGGYLDDATLDEYADMYPGIFGSIIRPMLADRQGTATFIGTPKGRNAFFDIAVPDAALRLVQACGRLIRHERDYGRITLLDRRVITRRYGQRLLDSLPPFRRELDVSL